MERQLQWAEEDPEGFAARKLEQRHRREADELKHDARVAMWRALAADASDESLAEQEQAEEYLESDEEDDRMSDSAKGPRTPPPPG